MNCSKCGEAMDIRGIVITLVNNSETYSAILHPFCLRGLIGISQARKLESVAFLSEWRQTGLPLLYDRK